MLITPFVCPRSSEKRRVRRSGLQSRLIVRRLDGRDSRYLQVCGVKSYGPTAQPPAAAAHTRLRFCSHAAPPPPRIANDSLGLRLQPVLDRPIPFLPPHFALLTDRAGPCFLSLSHSHSLLAHTWRFCLPHISLTAPIPTLFMRVSFLMLPHAGP